MGEVSNFSDDERGGLAEPPPSSSGLVNLSISDRETPNEAVSRALSEHAERHFDLPVCAVKKYRRDWVVSKEGQSWRHAMMSPDTKREEIKEFSLRSRYRLLHLAKNCDVDFMSMLTITYPGEFCTDGRKVKKHLHNFTKWLRREDEEIRGLWFLEFQKRGAPHFHMLLSTDLTQQGQITEKHRSGAYRGQKSPSYRTSQVCEDRAAASWYRIVGSGDQKHLKAGISWEILEGSEAAIKYAAKHAAKVKQKSVPAEFQSVGRFWGKIGPVNLVGGEIEPMTTAQIFEKFGRHAMSSKGRVKTYLWDASAGEP